jgi:hypothetical protein
MKFVLWHLAALAAVAEGVAEGVAGADAEMTVHMVVTDPEHNDIYNVATGTPTSPALKFVTHPTLDAALLATTAGDGLMLFADEMIASVKGVPQSNATTVISPSQWSSIERLHLVL